MKHLIMHAPSPPTNQLQKCSSRCGLIRGLSKNYPGPENVLVTRCVAFPLAANFYEEAIYRSIILFPPLFYSVWKPTMSELDTQSFNLPSFARSICSCVLQICLPVTKIESWFFQQMLPSFLHYGRLS